MKAGRVAKGKKNEKEIGARRCQGQEAGISEAAG
jgi:hypothetical protein